MMPEKLEEDLRTRIYEALVELGVATAEQKHGLVEHLVVECDSLRDLIVYGKIPDTVAVAQHPRG
jgi:hypothetical protein